LEKSLTQVRTHQSSGLSRVGKMEDGGRSGQKSERKVKKSKKKKEKKTGLLTAVARRVSRSRSRSRSPPAPRSSSASPPPAAAKQSSYSWSDSECVVLCVGSFTAQGGWGGDDCPRCLLQAGMDMPTESLWEERLGHTLAGLHADARDYPIMLSEPVMNPREVRAEQMEVLFEKIGAPLAYFEMDARMALYASGRTGGLICQIGHRQSQVVLFEQPGADDRHSFARPSLVAPPMLTGVSGSTITAELEVRMGQSCSAGILSNLKEKMCVIPDCNNCDDGNGSLPPLLGNREHLELPDGVDLTDHVRAAPEVMFDPSLLSCQEGSASGARGVAQVVAEMAAQDPAACYGGRPVAAVVLEGGSSLFPGFADRLSHELKEHQDQQTQHLTLSVVAPPERAYSVFIGGSILSSLSTFSSQWLDASDFREHGPSILSQRIPGGSDQFSGANIKAARGDDHT
jgi:Actin